MSNPGEFLQACADGRVWLYCAQCDSAKNFNQVRHINCIGNPVYWGPEPWWHDTRVFECPDCSTEQQSLIELSDAGKEI
jgi:hypothetical protein